MMLERRTQFLLVNILVFEFEFLSKQGGFDDVDVDVRAPGVC